MRNAPVEKDSGTRAGLHGQRLISLGLVDLDRILGGGLPLGSLLLVIEVRLFKRWWGGAGAQLPMHAPWRHDSNDRRLCYVKNILHSSSMPVQSHRMRTLRCT